MVETPFGVIRNGLKPRGVSTLTGLPPGLAAQIDPFRTSFEDWVGDEVSSRSIQQFVTAASGGAVFTVANVAPDVGDTETIGLLDAELTADPVAQKGGLRRQELASIAEDGFENVFFAHRFRMQSLVPDGANYQVNAGGLANHTGTGTLDYADGVFLIYDKTIGVVSWVIRCARGGANAQIRLVVPWDNAFHTIGFVHYGDAVYGFADGVFIETPEVGAEIQPDEAVGGIGFHIVAAAAGTDDGKIQSDWIWSGRLNA